MIYMIHTCPHKLYNLQIISPSYTHTHTRMHAHTHYASTYTYRHRYTYALTYDWTDAATHADTNTPTTIHLDTTPICTPRIEPSSKSRHWFGSSQIAQDIDRFHGGAQGCCGSFPRVAAHQMLYHLGPQISQRLCGGVVVG